MRVCGSIQPWANECAFRDLWRLQITLSQLKPQQTTGNPFRRSHDSFLIIKDVGTCRSPSPQFHYPHSSYTFHYFSFSNPPTMEKDLSYGRLHTVLVENVGIHSSGKIYYYHCKHPGCTYKTTRSGHMKRHERIHTKERPYKCTFCHYMASRSDHLRRHMKIHYKTICATDSPVLSDGPSRVICTSSSPSPATSPSPVISASSSPSLVPIAPAATPIPCSFLEPCAYDNGGKSRICS